VVIGFAASTTIAAAGREVGWKTALVVLLCTLIGCIAVAGEEHAPRSGAFDGVYEGFIEARCPSGWSERRLQLTVTRDLGAFVCTTCEVRRLTVVHVTAEGRVVFPSSMGVETEADLDPTRVLGAAPVACLVGDTVVAQPLGQFGLVRAQDAPLHLDPETERLSAAEGATNLGSLAAP
jgi:hypothetical protein